MAGTDYTINTEDSTSPTDANVARKGAAEIRGIKAKINSLMGILFTATGTGDAILGTLPTLASGLKVLGIPPAANTVVLPTLNAIPIVKHDSTSGAIIPLVAGDYNASYIFSFTYSTNGYLGAPCWILNAPLNNSVFVPEKRQTVYDGPVVAATGVPNFGGAAGGTVVTATGTIKATAAAGNAANYFGSIENPSWTGLNTNGTMYLGFNITSLGTITTFSTTLEPVYQYGGVPSVTADQYTYNISEGKMYRGNGVSADQVFAVFVGEVTVAGAVVTVITWYALNGRYTSIAAAFAAVGTKTNFAHNLGVQNGCEVIPEMICQIAEHGWAVGEIATPVPEYVPGGAYIWTTPGVGLDSRLSCSYTTGGNAVAALVVKTNGTLAGITAANWLLRISVYRKW